MIKNEPLHGVIDLTVLSHLQITHRSMPSSNIASSGEVLVMKQSENSESNPAFENSNIVTKKVSESRPETTPVPRCELEDFTRFSQCHLWKLMMSFYDRQGVDSWSQGIVPHFITSNAFIGKQYARVISSFITDCMNSSSSMALDPSSRLYIIELGTGSGKFSHFFISALAAMQHSFPFPLSQITYVMTDFTKKNFDFWNTHPALSQYVESGLVDFALFNATTDTEFTLAKSNVTLSRNSVKNPVIILANYLFDTLYHDLFQVSACGQVKTGLCSTGSSSLSEPDALDPAILKRLSNKFRYDEVQNNFYDSEEGDEDALNAILTWYKEYYESINENATLLVPIGALRAVRRLAAFSSSRAFILSGDKGHNNPNHFIGTSDPHIAVHGSFSVMVNYHAVGVYTVSKGGFALHNPQEEASLKVSAFVLTGDDKMSVPVKSDALTDICDQRSQEFPNTVSSFQEYLVDFGPNDFFVMQKCLKEETKAKNSSGPSLKSVVALLKLSQWDPDVFYKFRDAILDQIPSCGSKLRADLVRGISNVWKNYYMLDKDKDIAFEIGRFYYGIRDFKNALDFYQTSIDSVGDHHVTSHNMGLCYYSLGDVEKSLSYFTAAVNQNEAYEKAKSWRDRVRRELDDTTCSSQDVQIHMKDGKTLTILNNDNQMEV